jgi:hypothetical protein
MAIARSPTVPPQIDEEIDLNSLGAWCPHRGAEDRLTVELALRIVLRTLIKGSQVL